MILMAMASPKKGAYFDSILLFSHVGFWASFTRIVCAREISEHLKTLIAPLCREVYESLCRFQGKDHSAQWVKSHA